MYGTVDARKSFEVFRDQQEELVDEETGSTKY
jgi:hypothetical protein